jgi:hypothetical protein
MDVTAAVIRSAGTGAAMNDEEHQPAAPAASAPSPRDQAACVGAVRPWARAIDGTENPILEFSEEHIARLERRLGRPIDV